MPRKKKIETEEEELQTVMNEDGMDELLEDGILLKDEEAEA